MRIDEIQSNATFHRLLSAFCQAEYPGDRAISRCDLLDAFEEVRPLIRRSWEGLDVDEILTCPVRWLNTLEYLSADGLRYYLPAFLAIAVAFPGAARNVSGAVLRQLIPPTARSVADKIRFDQMVEGLSEEQIAAIRHCVRALGLRVVDGPFSSGD